MMSFADRALNEAQSAQFQQLLLEMTVSMALPFRWIERAEARRVFQFLRPAILPSLPSRRQLSDVILPQRAAIARENSLREISEQRERGVHIGLSCDGWKNVSRQHVLGVIIATSTVSFCYGHRECTDQHHGIEAAAEIEQLLLELEEKALHISSVCTDDAGQCGRARRILSLRHPRLHFEPCHQVT